MVGLSFRIFLVSLAVPALKKFDDGFLHLLWRRITWKVFGNPVLLEDNLWLLRFWLHHDGIHGRTIQTILLSQLFQTVSLGK